MDFALAEMATQDRYKLMASTILPRPIAWVVSQDKAGTLNAAPYSFFNMVSADPPLIVLGFLGRAGGGLKDSAANIAETQEFTISLVSEDDAAAMNFTCIDAPPEFDEIAAAGLEPRPSAVVAPPQIASAPVSFECRLYETIVPADGSSSIVLGEVVHMRIDDRFVDADRLHVDGPALGLVGRMHGAGWYTRTGDLFQMSRPVFADYAAAKHQGDDS